MDIHDNKQALYKVRITLLMMLRVGKISNPLFDPKKFSDMFNSLT